MDPLIETAPGSSGGGGPSSSPTYRHKLAQTQLTLGSAASLFEVFSASARAHADKPCLGWRPLDSSGKAGPFCWMDYAETLQQAADVGSALTAAGVRKGGRCAIFSINTPQWMITMQACNRQALACVPLYDTLGENSVEFIIDHSESTAVFVSAANFAKLVAAYPKTEKRVKTVVFWGTVEPAQQQALGSQGVTVQSFDEFRRIGAGRPVDPVPAQPADLCTIMYTSGTTGAPKGVLLSHRAVMAAAVAQALLIDHYNIGGLGPGDAYLSYLPLAHIFDRVVEELMLSKGGCIGFYQGDVKLVIEDISALRPTIFAGVPRVFDRVYGGITAKVKESGGVKAFLFNRGFRVKLRALNSGHAYDKASPMYDWLVFNKVKQRLGGRVRLVVSGAAPLAPHVEDFLRVTMCCPVLQGYGLTESCATSFVGAPNNPATAGTIGFPFPAIEFKLESIPEMNYDAQGSPARGELLLRGTTLFEGYYKQEDKTREAMDAQGWLHTGDVGELTAKGAMRIVDRKKNIFKLAQGEYVAVESLESAYGKCGLTQQLWVYGNSFESTLVAVAVPDEDALMKWAAKAGVSGSFQEVCRNAKTKEHLLKELTAAGKASKLKGFEMIKDVLVEPTPFSVEQDTLTPTFKYKRPQLAKQYEKDIDAMYKAINAKFAARQ